MCTHSTARESLSSPITSLDLEHFGQGMHHLPVSPDLRWIAGHILHRLGYAGARLSHGMILPATC